MEREEIVKTALKEGVLLSPECLDLGKDEINFLISKAKEKGKIVALPQRPKVVIRAVKPKQLVPLEYVLYFNAKYNGLKAIIERKMPAVSINKISSGQTSVIGMVREITESGFIIEDPTGCIEVVSKEKPKEDSVIGIIGHVREKKLWPERLVWPDIPLTNNPSSLPYIITIKGKKIQIEDNLFEIQSTPTWIKIIDKNIVNILAYQTDNPHPKEWLKYRHLNPEITQITSTEDFWLLEPIPDMIWIISEKQFKDFYKGVIICSPGNDSAKIDLSKWEIYFKEEDTKA